MRHLTGSSNTQQHEFCSGFVYSMTLVDNSGKCKGSERKKLRK